MSEGDELPDEQGAAAEPDQAAGPLPDLVRSRVVKLAADALGRLSVAHLPAPLKRAASFAPARRARLAGSQIASILETDDQFRERIAIQVRTQVPELSQALESGTTPAAADPVELAAVAYLLRPQGWLSVVAAAAQRAEEERSSATNRQVLEQLDRLGRQLADAVAELRETRERNRQQVAALKAENTELRRKLGEVRVRTRTAEQSEQQARSAAEVSTGQASAAASAADAESRRLRSRVEELERDVATGQKAGRAVKDGGSLRARLLLDTLLESAQGLRRELALPAVAGAPADAVEAHVAEQGSRTSTSHGSMSSDDPALLDQLLKLPRLHLIVDGYNVTMNAYPASSLEIQRDRLLAGLAPLAARSGAEVTVVFDAAESSQRPLVNMPRGVRVLFSPFGVIADDVIRELVAAEPQGRPLVVVSSDQEVVRDVKREGARCVAAAALSRLIARV